MCTERSSNTPNDDDATVYGRSAAQRKRAKNKSNWYTLPHPSLLSLHAKYQVPAQNSAKPNPLECKSMPDMMYMWI